MTLVGRASWLFFFDVGFNPVIVEHLPILMMTWQCHKRETSVINPINISAVHRKCHKQNRKSILMQWTPYRSVSLWSFNWTKLISQVCHTSYRLKLLLCLQKIKLNQKVSITICSTSSRQVCYMLYRMKLMLWLQKIKKI